MNDLNFSHHNWAATCVPEDGARIKSISFNGFHLLTSPPVKFRPPSKDFGLYENRPVYGYDDCFPTVDACMYPTDDFMCSDHGELCWQKWDVTLTKYGLVCKTQCPKTNIQFERALLFHRNSLTWKFQITNPTKTQMPFIHAMHPLMPIHSILSIKLPEYKKLYDESQQKRLDKIPPHQLCEKLIVCPEGSSYMFILQNIKKGQLELQLRGLKLKISFPTVIYPSLAVWYNNMGYPSEDGVERCECAFEPLSSISMNLHKAYSDQQHKSIKPNEILNWEVQWEINKTFIKS